MGHSRVQGIAAEPLQTYLMTSVDTRGGGRASTGLCVDVKSCAHGRIGSVAPPHDAFFAADLLVCGPRAGDLVRQLAS